MKMEHKYQDEEEEIINDIDPALDYEEKVGE